MDIELKMETIQLLNEYYQINTEEFSTQRMKWEWEAENNRGFLLGMDKTFILKNYMVFFLQLKKVNSKNSRIS